MLWHTVFLLLQTYLLNRLIIMWEGKVHALDSWNVIIWPLCTPLCNKRVFNYCQTSVLSLSTVGSLVDHRAFKPYTLAGPPVLRPVLAPLAAPWKPTIYVTGFSYEIWNPIFTTCNLRTVPKAKTKVVDYCFRTWILKPCKLWSSLSTRIRWTVRRTTHQSLVLGGRQIRHSGLSEFPC